MRKAPRGPQSSAVAEERRRRATIIIAEDDDDDYMLTKEALKNADFKGSIHRCIDGEELMDYLGRRGRELFRGNAAVLLLLDLNMPRKDGRDVLLEIKSDPELRRLPIVVLTTSAAESDVANAYDLGANSFVRKPGCFEDLEDCLASLKKYWIEVAEIPPAPANKVEIRP